MNLGKVIKLQRVRKDLTQTVFAEKCDISQGYLSQIELNIKKPNAQVLERIAAILDIPVPILYFMSLEHDDIKENLRVDFKQLSRPINALINEFY